MPVVAPLYHGCPRRHKPPMIMLHLGRFHDPVILFHHIIVDRRIDFIVLLVNGLHTILPLQAIQVVYIVLLTFVVPTVLDLITVPELALRDLLDLFVKLKLFQVHFFYL